jgi:hypothetical protein
MQSDTKYLRIAARAFENINIGEGMDVTNIQTQGTRQVLFGELLEVGT